LKSHSVYIGGIGIICSLGSGPVELEEALRENRSAIRPLDLFELFQGDPLPVGQVQRLEASSSLPRTLQLAHIAAAQAMEGISEPPDAVVLGTTTGGILTSEYLLRQGDQQKELYKYHGLHSVANYIADELNCTGPAISVSTACSSGVVAIAVGLQMLRSGQARSVLVGGVDSISRLDLFRVSLPAAC
jgi:3-oxoacyl-(acyl-carrier-protein) synthase